MTIFQPFAAFPCPGAANTAPLPLAPFGLLSGAGVAGLLRKDQTISTTTLSGPAETADKARHLLIDAGYSVLTVPTEMRWLELVEGDAFVSVDGSHSDVASVVSHLGWRHRGTMATPVTKTGIGFPLGFPLSFQ
jgi:hypothetical protein